MGASPRVLVAYATAAGSTTGVAERVADVMRTAGCDAVCRPAGPDLDLTGFDALVVGSAVHGMAWLPDAVDLVGRAAASRGGAPAWCFSVGGVNPHGRLTWYLARQEAERVERQFPAGFAVREHRVFAGVVETHGVPLWARLMYRLTGTRAGDNRDWPAIEAWARNIAADLITETARDRGAPAWQYRPPEPPAAW
jgi:menaquinone-dependent protoporphyrinogen oxidase